jgi:uncharacterized protein (DUF1800 family)
MIFLSTYQDASLPIRYEAGQYRDGKPYPAVNELRSLSLLGADLPDLFFYNGTDDVVPPPERDRPRREVIAATLLACTDSKTPWVEEWIGFWRDHFSVYGHDGNVRAFLPHWDREVIRKYAFGNFRQMLEASSTHPCMLYYLNNRSSRAGSANENFARELFELHTLGRKAYLNTLYSQWRKVPGAIQGRPAGYVDEDVYEAARSFTGWAVEDGTGLGGGQNLPKTGRFTYIESWHDNYQKRVLAQEIAPYQGAMQDGRKVLDLCAFHKATSQHLAYKLVKRFVSDDPPADLIQSTAKVWSEHAHSDVQLQKVCEHLVRSANGSTTKKIGLQAIQATQKVKRPMRLAASFCQAVKLPFVLGDGTILWVVESSGPSIYSWVSPEGPPDAMTWYLSGNYLRQRMMLLQGLAENWWGTGEWDPFNGLPHNPTFEQALSRWEKALFGKPRPDLSLPLLASQNTKPQEKTTDARRLRRLVGLLACSPSFQTEQVFPPEALQAPLV